MTPGKICRHIQFLLKSPAAKHDFDGTADTALVRKTCHPQHVQLIEDCLDCSTNAVAGCNPWWGSLDMM